MRAGIAGLWLAAVASLGACGPVQYISQVTSRASTELAAAKSAGAQKYAPYEYTTAELYLHKAREEAGSSDYQAAIRFGKKSEIMARKARRLAIESTSEPPEEGDEAAPPAPIDPSASPPAPAGGEK